MQKEIDSPSTRALKEYRKNEIKNFKLKALYDQPNYKPFEKERRID